MSKLIQLQSVVTAFKIFFKMNTSPIRLVQSDSGKEFKNRKLYDLFKQHKVKHFTSFTEVKATIVERFNRTLRERLERWFTFSGKHRYIGILPKLTESYNSTIHRSHGLRPSEVSKENEHLVWTRLYEDYFAQPKGQPVFKVGDKVRISRVKSVFAKGAEQSYSEEIFSIYKIDTSFKPVVYYIMDSNSEPITGIFYKYELSLVVE